MANNIGVNHSPAFYRTPWLANAYDMLETCDNTVKQTAPNVG